ncbi:MAG: hypothetical protein ABEJ96_05980 [Thiohalorhabdaceae bacterium]
MRDTKCQSVLAAVPCLVRPANARPGSVIILHDRPDLAEPPARKLARILAELTRGFRLLTLSRLVDGE